PDCAFRTREQHARYVRGDGHANSHFSVRCGAAGGHSGLREEERDDTGRRTACARNACNAVRNAAGHAHAVRAGAGTDATRHYTAVDADAAAGNATGGFGSAAELIPRPLTASMC